MPEEDGLPQLRMGFPLQYLNTYAVSLLYVKLLTLKYSTSLKSCIETIHNVT